MAEQAEITPEQIKAQAERDRLLAVRVALTETSRTRGWAYIKQIADNIVLSSLQHSLNVEDETESEQFRIDARVGKRVFGQLFAVIEESLNFGTESEPEWFSELNAFAEQGEVNASTEEIRG